MVRARPTYFVANFLYSQRPERDTWLDICSLRTISESNHGRVRPKANEVGTKDAPRRIQRFAFQEEENMKKTWFCSLLVLLTIVGGTSALFGQQTPYKQTNEQM